MSKKDPEAELKAERARRERAEKQLLMSDAQIQLRDRGWSAGDARVAAAVLSGKGALALDDDGKPVFRDTAAGFDRPFENGIREWATTDEGKKLRYDQAQTEQKQKKGASEARGKDYDDHRFGIDVAKALFGEG